VGRYGVVWEGAGFHHVIVDSTGRVGTGPCGRERPPGYPRSLSPSPYSREDEYDQ